MNNITIFTYTHSNCKDLWPTYFDLLNHYAPDIKSIVASNEVSNDYHGHKFFKYEDKHYCQELVDIIKQNVQTEYFIYMQEDFFLYDSPNWEKIKKYINIMKSKKVDFIRLIKCGDVTELNFEDDLFYIKVPVGSYWSVNSYSMQPTIWNKDRFCEFYKQANWHAFKENLIYTDALNKTNILGLYAYNNEPKRGMMHYDSSVFPYIATALVCGKWNVGEYPTELNPILKKYNIDVNLRGVM
jgi:hypothetical protein